MHDNKVRNEEGTEPSVSPAYAHRIRVRNRNRKRRISMIGKRRIDRTGSRPNFNFRRDSTPIFSTSS